MRLGKRRVPAGRDVELPEHAAPVVVVDQVAGAVLFVRSLLARDGYATDDPETFWCPCCAGAVPSLRVTEADEYGAEGLALLRCSAGCSPADILPRLGLRVAYGAPDGLLRLSAVVPLAIA